LSNKNLLSGEEKNLIIEFKEEKKGRKRKTGRRFCADAWKKIQGGEPTSSDRRF
jgi:hypothetical protein